MDAMKPRLGYHVPKEPIGDLGIGVRHLPHKTQDHDANDQRRGIHANQEADRNQNQWYSECIFEPMVIIIDGVQFLNGVVYRVNAPQYRNVVQDPAEPIVEEIVYEKAYAG